ncbi:magnesium/cobalt transporter CorA [Ameyamaea chiangmaiensis NBRC 103196]|uniref:Magnesium transporter CorA family protein n=1 Tax=Ameyamaea chiangmaiensis TaxID=442969 RepID=A0A850P4Y5_9PROT|nr:magnesium transporter CorA family protein [Ameyamaea chiangmaiensis]MBS4074939.1 magnesium transporter CorA family protein [Ameyamaea chiangmaiensis]NVN39705.1 magnesium transporter CorA family protein [Ameyamaea chiangmaiensis]GBQ63268.1 magnesium/cobalt transporter CorA [Ameyamaea chiangmaiensis NBRC 103196]
MLVAHRSGAAARDVRTATDAADATWLDLYNPTEDEIALAAQITGLTIPRRDDLDEIESSSRLFMKDDSVYLSTPLVRRREDDFTVTPVGFVLAPHILVTVRFADYSSFATAAARLAEGKERISGDEVAVLLLEAVVDRLADILEHMGTTLDSLSRDVFGVPAPQRANAANRLRRLLRRVGRSGDLASALRDSLLGLERISIYISENKKHDLSPKLMARLKTIGRDIASLNDFVAQTMNKVQFLLDATLGFISIDQNDGMKLLTVVSFVGVAPTLIAGIYGMNFKVMPELNWHYGYAYALGLITVSAVLPMIWFWRRGWFGAT